MDARARLKEQLRFIVEADRLKEVLRQTVLTQSRRRENSAEHSWHIALMALILAEHANQPDLDLLRVLKMLLIHDIVEIDAGDALIYDAAAQQKKGDLEKAAAERLFGLLPHDQQREYRQLWDEFEARETAEAKFARALDRVQPILLNFHTEGHAWKTNRIRRGQVIEANRHLGEGSEALWQQVESIVEEAVRAGFLAPDRPAPVGPAQPAQPKSRIEPKSGSKKRL